MSSRCCVSKLDHTRITKATRGPHTRSPFVTELRLMLYLSPMHCDLTYLYEWLNFNYMACNFELCGMIPQVYHVYLALKVFGGTIYMNFNIRLCLTCHPTYWIS
jgi:hypothetical protein